MKVMVSKFCQNKKKNIEFDVIILAANLKKILNKITEAKGNKELITSAMDHLQPLITAANIGENFLSWFGYFQKSSIKFLIVN